MKPETPCWYIEMDPKRVQNGSKPNSNLRYLSPQSSTTTWNNMSLEDESNNEILQQIQELNKDADNTIQFVRGVSEILFATTPATILLVMIAAFTVVETIVGFHYLEKCPLESRIPVFLFVDGCFGLLKAVHLLVVSYRIRKHSHACEHSDYGREQRANNIVDVALDIFLIVWQIVGTCWIFSIFHPLCEAPLHEPNNHCDCFLYDFGVAEVGLFCFLTVADLTFHLLLAVFYKYTNLFES